MKVSIIGAGLSGLACAFQLEKLGITPMIYEENNKVGNYYPKAEAILNILSRPIRDPFAYLGQQYELYLQPSQTINHLVIHSPKKEARIHGFQGFTNLRGDLDTSLERQLLRKIKAPIYYNSLLSYQQILNDSDQVVVATGDIQTAGKIQSWKKGVEVEMIVATIRGDFQPDEVQLWLNRDFAPNGYGYLLPWNNMFATLAIGIPKQSTRIEIFWERFLKQLRFEFSIKEQFDIKRYFIGQPERNQIANTYFVGNAGGFIFPFMGFGQFPSIISGILAAESIVNQLDYNQVVKDFRHDYQRSLQLRRWFEKLDQTHFDLITGGLNLKSIDKLYGNTEFNLPKWLGKLLN